VDLVLWLPNSKPDYWTDGHIDGVARFVKPGVVLVDQGLPETVKFLRETPNGAVIMPSFGQIKSDQRARDLIASAFPDRQIVPIRLDAIASGGGLMHCVTQQEPAA